MIKPLKKIDITISIFNQEEIIERVLFGIFSNTTTPFNLILVFDGCTDRTKPRALKYIKKARPKLLDEFILKDTPNLFELKANNECFKLAKTDYLVTVQDDMVIKDYGWERRLTFPLRKFDDVFAVTARVAEDLKSISSDNEVYENRMGLELGTLPRNIFAVRDVINRGPIAFKADYLRELNYLNERYAPGAKDDTEISLRAWIQKKWKVGAFYIKYLSKKEWSKVNASDSTMKAWESCRRNQNKIYEDFKEYINSGIKHDEDYVIEREEIDYIRGFNNFIKRYYYKIFYPLRIDKRAFRSLSISLKSRVVLIVKYPFIFILRILFGKDFYNLSKEIGFKRAFNNKVKGIKE